MDKVFLKGESYLEDFDSWTTCAYDVSCVVAVRDAEMLVPAVEVCFLGGHELILRGTVDEFIAGMLETCRQVHRTKGS